MGLSAHDFPNQAIDRRNAAFLFAAAEHLGSMHIPGSQIGPGPFTEIFVFDSGGTTRRRRQNRKHKYWNRDFGGYVVKQDLRWILRPDLENDQRFSPLSSAGPECTQSLTELVIDTVIKPRSWSA